MNFSQLKTPKFEFDNLKATRNYDKNGHFYHVMTRSFNSDSILDKELGKYRHSLLCRGCAMNGVEIVISAATTNCTHEILMADEVGNISEAIRQVNIPLAHEIKKRSKQKYSDGHKVFQSKPVFQVIKDVEELIITAKKIYDKIATIEAQGGYIPYSCFWTMSKGFLPRPYSKKVYQLIFNMTEIQLYHFFANTTEQNILQAALELTSQWTQQDNINVFMKNPQLGWQR